MWVRKTPAAGGCQMFEFRSNFTAVPRGAVPSAMPKSAPPGFTGTGHQFGHQPSAARCSALVGDYARRYPISNVNPGQCYTVFSDGALVGSRP